jgi:hypothetical protein
MKEILVRAQFTSSNNIYPHTFLQDTPPEVITVLHSLYPILIIANRILSFITWTSHSYYRNFALIFIYVLVILHWNNYFILFLPSLVVLIFCCYAWFIKISFIDVKYGNDISPTLEEILDTLENFTSRFSFLINLDQLSSNVFDSTFKLFINLLLLTPFYVFIMQNYLSINIWFVVVSLCIFIYYSTWFIALRRLLWRFKHIRKITNFFTGENYSMVDKDLEITILNFKTRGSINEYTKIVEFHLIENERRWIGLGWSKKMLFFEKRTPYYNAEFKKSLYQLYDFQFPKLTNYKNSEWKWIDDKWITDPSGWTYYDYEWKNPHDSDSITRYTRSRHLKRQCFVVLKK